MQITATQAIANHYVYFQNGGLLIKREKISRSQHQRFILSV